MANLRSRTSGVAPQFVSQGAGGQVWDGQRLGGRTKMLRIEKDGGGCVTRLRLSGRIQSDQIASIRSEIDDDCTKKILDLRDVTLVDLGGVRFLIGCEDEGIKLVQCPAYVREWMLRERAEEAQPGSSDVG